MKKLNWQKVLNILFAALLAALGTNEVKQMIDEAQPIEASAEPLAAVPGAPIKYVVDVQVVWKNTPNALPGTHYLVATHRVEMPTIPNIGNTFNEVKRLFVAGKIKAPVDSFVPVYGYTATLIARTGIPLADDGKKPEPANPINE
jgi:hypothetical protein